MAESARAAFGYRDFRLYQASRFASTLAIQMQSVAVGWHVYALTHRPLDLGLVGLVQAIPAFGLSLVTGSVDDRFDRRRILVACELLAALTGALLATASWLAHGHPSTAWIYAMLFVFGTARAFAGPAGEALLPSIVTAEHFGSAVAWSSTTWQVATIAGPAVGGGLYTIAGAPVVYAIAATLGCVGAGFLVAMRVRTGRMERGVVTRELVFAGVRYVWANKPILGSISLDLFAVLLGGAEALLPIYANDVLHTGPWGLGILRSAPAVGAAAMSIVIAHRPLRRRVGAGMLGGVAVFGVATIVFGVSRWLPLSVIALAVVGAADMVSVVVRRMLVQLATPPEMRGRVSAVNQVFIVASNEIGEFESGVVASLIGAVPAVIVGGIGTLVVVGLWTVLFPSLARMERIEARDARGSVRPP